MIHSSPSWMMPSGAMCTRPAALTVVTMVSRIIGIGLALGFCAQRVPGRLQSGAILRRGVGRAAEIERFVLRIAFAEPPRDLGLGQLGAKIERVRAVACHIESVEQRE